MSNLAELDRAAETPCASARAKKWSSDHIQLAVACNCVSRKLLDLANTEMVQAANPALSRGLIDLAGELRRGFRPQRPIPSRKGADDGH
jgi:hypothetical protein